MKMAIAQMACQVGYVQANLKKISGFIELASDTGSKVVIFPELVDTGYDISRISKFASTWNPGPVRFIQKAAEKNRIYVVCGLSEVEGENIYNVLAVINPNGQLVAKYRKSHLAAFSPLDEDQVITPGNTLEIVQIGDLQCGLIICYDLRFPEISRTLALAGADVIILSAAWPFPRLRHWNTLIDARAIENQVYMAAANHVGSNSRVTFCGSSKIVDPFGVIVASASEEKELLITGDIVKNNLVHVRKAMPVLEHRREVLYGNAISRKHSE